jgi:hypothetical protein
MLSPQRSHQDRQQRDVNEKNDQEVLTDFLQTAGNVPNILHEPGAILEARVGITQDRSESNQNQHNGECAQVEIRRGRQTRYFFEESAQGGTKQTIHHHDSQDRKYQGRQESDAVRTHLLPSNFAPAELYSSPADPDCFFLPPPSDTLANDHDNENRWH